MTGIWTRCRPVVPGGCSGLTDDLGWDTTVQDDHRIIAFDDIRVVMDKKSYLYINGTELDFSDGLARRQRVSFPQSPGRPHLCLRRVVRSLIYPLISRWINLENA